MKRIRPLPSHLVPWFRLDETGGVNCRKCPQVFRGKEATDLQLARHASIHMGYRKPDGKTVDEKVAHGD